MTAALALQLIIALIGDMPTLVVDIENFIAGLKGQAAKPVPPVTPSIIAEDAALLAKLQGK